MSTGNFFDNDLTVIFLILIAVGLADITPWLAAVLALVGIAAGVIKIITLVQQVKISRLEQRIKQKQLDDANSE
ncbi:MAG: hypothetical protein WA958_01595 [Tunicatimonas sp.]